MLLVVNGFAALPRASIEVGSVDTTLIWIYYAVLAAALWLNTNRKKWTNLIPKTTARLKSGVSHSSSSIARLSPKWVIPPLLVAAILASFTAATMPDDNLHVSFLNVGEGDATLIQKGHQQLLVDGGPSPQAICLGLSQKMPFWDRTIDLVVLTHPDADHVTGLVEVLQRYQVKQVLHPDLDSQSDIYDEWLKIVREKNIKGTIAQVGQQIDLGEATIKVLNPQKTPLTGTESDIDNNGVVLQLSMGEVSSLLTGDIFHEAEFELISHRASLTSTVLKIAHHGSSTSTTEEFLAVANPQLAVISAGADNKFGHPSDEVMDSLEERIGSENIYHTDEQGTIELITDGERLWVKVER